MEQQIPPPEEVYAAFARGIDTPAAHHLFNFYAHTHRRGVKRVHLLIQSGGGNVGDGIAIRNFLLESKIETITYNIGNVASIAVAIFLAGKVRRAAANSSFMIHKGTNSFGFPARSDFLRTRAESLEGDDQTIEAILREQISMPDECWRAYANSDFTICPREAVEYKLIHEIMPFSPKETDELYNI